jgi:ADP-ribose pyrophosphatase
MPSKTILKTPIFHVTHDRTKDPAGHPIERFIVRHQGSAIVMPVNAGGEILLARQFRLPANAYLWEIPAGRIDPGETPLAAAKRELIEETGLRAKRWKRLFSLYMSPGFLDEKMHIFLATGLTQGPRVHLDGEHIESRWFPQTKIDAMIRRGQLLDGKTVAAFYAFRAQS